MKKRYVLLTKRTNMYFYNKKTIKNSISLSFTKHLLLTQLLAVTFQSPLFEHLANSFVESLRT